MTIYMIFISFVTKTEKKKTELLENGPVLLLLGALISHANLLQISIHRCLVKAKLIPGYQLPDAVLLSW